MALGRCRESSERFLHEVSLLFILSLSLNKRFLSSQNNEIKNIKLKKKKDIKMKKPLKKKLKKSE